MESTPSTLDLWQALATAQQAPEAANLRILCQTLEQYLPGHSLHQQLEIAGTVLEQLAEVLAVRAQRLIDAYEQHYDPQEPIVHLESCVELFIQSLHLDLSDLLEPEAAVQYPAERQSPTAEAGTVVGGIDKAALLAQLEQRLNEHPGMSEAEAFDTTIAVAHGEDVTRWSEAIAQQFENGKLTSATLLKLQHCSKLSLVEVWLGLLLGGYHLVQQGEFYDGQTIVVTLPEEAL